MDEFYKIAFRNIFRNLRRSLLTIFISTISVLFLVAGSSFLGGMFGGILDESIKNTGHVRITAGDYELKERMMSLTASITDYNRLKKKIDGEPSVTTVAGRLKFGAMLYKGDESKEGLGFGIEEADIKIQHFKDYIYMGKLLNTRSKDEILVGRKLAESLKLRIGDEVMLLTRTRYNSTWALNFRVTGIFDLQSGRLNKSFYISLPAAQELLDMNDRVTEILVFGKSTRDTTKLMNNLGQLPDTNRLLLKKWNQIGLAPIFTGIITIVSSIIQLIFIILAGLGIANTMMMAVFERRGEIGLLKSMGMHEEEIVRLFTLEGLILGLTGTILGMILGGTLAYLLSTYGLDVGTSLQGLPLVIKNKIYGVFNSGIFIKGASLGIISAILASLIPAVNGVRLKPTEALRK